MAMPALAAESYGCSGGAMSVAASVPIIVATLSCDAVLFDWSTDHGFAGRM
jgi:hypothetical protein